jgi:hypothetical protein
MLPMTRASSWVAVVSALAGCGDGGPRADASGSDAGARDAASLDGGLPDAGGDLDAGSAGACREVALGDRLTVSGGSFGERRDFNDTRATWHGQAFLAFRFKDMEDGELESMGFYPQRSGAPWEPTPSELSIVEEGDNRFVRRAFDDEEIGGLSADLEGAENQVYVTFKFSIEAETQSGKFFRLYADSPQNNFFLSTGCDNTFIRGFSECDAFEPCLPETEWGAEPAITPDRWHRLEVWVDANAGMLRVSIDGEIAWEKDDWLHATLGANGHTIDFPNMIDEPGPDRCDGNPDWSGSYSYDDLFVDFTAARVELAGDRSWDASSVREIQIASEWSSDSVAFLANRGALESGRDYFVHVVRADGTVAETGECVRFAP